MGSVIRLSNRLEVILHGQATKEVLIALAEVLRNESQRAFNAAMKTSNNAGTNEALEIDVEADALEQLAEKFL